MLITRQNLLSNKQRRISSRGQKMFNIWEIVVCIFHNPLHNLQHNTLKLVFMWTPICQWRNWSKGKLSILSQVSALERVKAGSELDSVLILVLTMIPKQSNQAKTYNTLIIFVIYFYLRHGKGLKIGFCSWSCQLTAKKRKSSEPTNRLKTQSQCSHLKNV